MTVNNLCTKVGGPVRIPRTSRPSVRAADEVTAGVVEGHNLGAAQLHDADSRLQFGHEAITSGDRYRVLLGFRLNAAVAMNLEVLCTSGCGNDGKSGYSRKRRRNSNVYSSVMRQSY